MADDSGADRPEALGVKVGSTRTVVARETDGTLDVENALTCLATCEDALTGGRACIPGIVDQFADRLTEELERGVDATTSDDPEIGAAIGAERIADRLVDLEQY
jgi:hypothetical protein